MRASEGRSCRWPLNQMLGGGSGRRGMGGREVDALGKLVLLAWNAVLYQSNYSCWRDAEARLWHRECVRICMLQRQSPPHPHISPSTDCKRGRAGSLLMGWMGRETWGIRSMERRLRLRTMAVLGSPCSQTPLAWPPSFQINSIADM